MPGSSGEKGCGLTSTRCLVEVSQALRPGRARAGGTPHGKPQPLKCTERACPPSPRCPKSVNTHLLSLHTKVTADLLEQEGGAQRFSLGVPRPASLPGHRPAVSDTGARNAHSTSLPGAYMELCRPGGSLRRPSQTVSGGLCARHSWPRPSQSSHSPEGLDAVLQIMGMGHREGESGTQAHTAG